MPASLVFLYYTDLVLGRYRTEKIVVRFADTRFFDCTIMGFVRRAQLSESRAFMLPHMRANDSEQGFLLAFLENK